MGRYNDSNPVAGAKKGGGMKNVDGRLGGEKYNKQDESSSDNLPSRKQSINGCKEVGVNPNQDLKQLNGGKNRVGKEWGAY